MIEVRDARPDDADGLAAAHIEGWRVGYRGLFPDEYLDDPLFASTRLERWRMWTWQEFVGSEMLSAVVDDRVVGFAHVGPERTPDGEVTVDATARGPRFEQPVGEVYGFYLHPDAWGSGVATVLMERALERLRAQGHAAAVLWVLRDNPRARGFYEKAGWQWSGLATMWPGPLTTVRPPEPVPEVQYSTLLK